MWNDTSETKACAQGKIIFIGTVKATGGAQGWGHVSSNTCQWWSLPGESPKAQERWQLVPKWSEEVTRILEGLLEVANVGDMNCSTPVNEDPCQGEMPKARSPNILRKIWK